jgi:hypothetical protein
MLTLLALSQHGQCSGVLLRAPVTHWASIPSLPARSGEHPFHRIASPMAPGVEVPLTAAATTANPRAVDVRHFSAEGPLPPDSHVLVVDDTWTQGGHAQSAALALRRAGAARVSVLVVARWINPAFGGNQQFLRGLPDYDPDICPWTAQGCPPS